MVIQEEVIDCLSKAVSILTENNFEVSKFEDVLHGMMQIQKPLAERNRVPFSNEKGDLETFVNLSVAACLDARGVAVSVQELKKSGACFFGRISTSGPSDYYIALVDACDYFLRVGFEGEWIPIPHVPNRKLVHYRFTGVPTARVNSHPLFGGSEIDLLGVIVPLIHKEAWVFPMNPLERIPTTTIVPSVHMAQQPRLSAYCRPSPHKSLDRDPAGLWIAEYTGDTNVYIAPGDKDWSLGRIAIRNTDWPGSLFFLTGTRSFNIYIGDGMHKDYLEALNVMPHLLVQSETLLPLQGSYIYMIFNTVYMHSEVFRHRSQH